MCFFFFKIDINPVINITNRTPLAQSGLRSLELQFPQSFCVIGFELILELPLFKIFLKYFLRVKWGEAAQA